MSGCEFRGSGWGWDRRCQDPGARGLGPGGGSSGDPYHMRGGGGGATRNTGPYIYSVLYVHIYIYIYMYYIIYIIYAYCINHMFSCFTHHASGSGTSGLSNSETAMFSQEHPGLSHVAHLISSVSMNAMQCVSRPSKGDLSARPSACELIVGKTPAKPVQHLDLACSDLLHICS